MFIQKMPWAGIHVQLEETKVVIDPLFYLAPEFGAPKEPMYTFDEFGSVDAVLITHIHNDHFDPKAIALFYGKDIPVYVPEETVEEARQSSLTNIVGVTIGKSFEIGSLTITPTYAVDGIGDVQVAYVVEGGGKRIFHTGDTLWHGYWWKIAARFGPFDAVFLPINGAVIQNQALTYSEQPIVMTPEQAVSASIILQAKTLVPIHYGLIHQPPFYQPTSQALDRLIQSAKNKMELTILKAKETISL
jgi:L-ascorbate metabolism protein UlaG (beta-lactamase superfamily)